MEESPKKSKKSQNPKKIHKMFSFSCSFFNYFLKLFVLNDFRNFCRFVHHIIPENPGGYEKNHQNTLVHPFDCMTIA